MIARPHCKREVAAALGGRLCIAALVCVGTMAHAQAPAPHDLGPREIAGRVVQPAGDTLRGVEGVWIVLHRVASDTAGPVDSTRSGAAGDYRIAYRQSGDERTIYFVSAHHDGIAYFSPPIPPAGASEDEAELIVYDTASAGIPLSLAGRHIVVSTAGEDGLRDVVEVYEVANQTDRTLVSPDDQQPTWSGRLPAGATGVRIGEGDVPQEAVRVEHGALHVVAPMAPGLKQFSLAYRVAPDAFPLRISLDSSVATLEVLLEDPAMRVEGAGLAPSPSVTVEGREFRRFEAAGVAAGSEVRVLLPALGQSRSTMYVAVLLVAIMAAMLIALARSFKSRGAAVGVPAAGMPPVPRSADALAREIAALDREFERTPPEDREMREAFTVRRAALKNALERALAEGERAK
ncbi:MAG TPA: hypothetical protein VMM77_06020 [Gemmatimonadaceae bacterium]|nr:hypothetical protein [Gemmatimonadaceae bacterium]